MQSLLKSLCVVTAGAEVDVNTPLRLVTLFRDREVYKEPENPKLATWKQDLDRRLLELEEAAAVRLSPNVSACNDYLPVNCMTNHNVSAFDLAL